MSNDRKFESKEELREKLNLEDPKLEKEFEILLEKYDEKKVYEFLKKYGGIPVYSQRLKYWDKILACEEVRREGGLYKDLLERDGNPIFLQTIQQDVNRTFPYYTFFKKGGKGQESLYRILKAYSIFDEELGYCQGMAYMGAIVLLHYYTDEEEAFWTFTRMMKNRSFEFQSIFARNMIKLKISLFLIKQLLEIECPRLSKYFDSLDLGPEIYCCTSFCTLFTMYFQFETTTFIWDVFFLKGWGFLLSLQLGILKSLEETLLKSGFVEVQNIVNKYLETIKPNEVIDLSQRVVLNDELLKKWEDEYSLITLEKELKKKNLRGLGSLKNEDLFANIAKIEYSQKELEAKEEVVEEEEEKEIDDIFGDLEEGEKKIDELTDLSKKKEKKSLLFGLDDEEDEVNFGDVNKISQYLVGLDDKDDKKLEKESNKEEEDDFTFDFD